MYTWTVTAMYQNSFDRAHAPTDPNAHYMWALRRDSSECTEGSRIGYAEVKLLMQHFAVSEASMLVGKSFTSEKDDPSNALSFLLTQIRHGGNYLPPSYESLRQRAAEAMARMEQPDFSDVDHETIYRAFQEVWDGDSAKKGWMKSFKAEIAKLSEGKAVLLDADSRNFSVRVNGPANYMELVSGPKHQKVIFGPYSSPVIFVD